MSAERTIIVCSWQDCPFVASVTKRFAETYGLTRREHEVFERVVDGEDIQQTASGLVISIGTVKAHLHRIYRKCHVSGCRELLQAFGTYGRRR